MKDHDFKLKTSLLYFALVCLFGSSCKDDSEDVERSPCYLKSIISTSNDGNNLIKTATYDAEHELLTESYNYSQNDWSFHYTFTYEYNTDGKISQVITSGDNPGTTIYSYDPQGDWIKTDHYNSDNQLEYKEVYDVNASGQVTKASFYYPATTLSQYFVYEYPNSTSYNYTSLKSYNGSGVLQQTTECKYDNMQAASNSLIFHSPTHNTTKATTKDGNGNVISTNTVEYKYNKNGYPIQSTFTSSGTSSITIEILEYDCL